MFRNRTPVAIALALTALIASSMSASAAPTAPDRVQRVDRASQPGQAQEFVVAFDGSAAAGTVAVEAADGTVVDVNEDAGLALVSTTNRDFVAEVSDQAGVTGVARNHAVGTTRPGMPHRFAEERPTTAERAAAGSRTSGRRTRTSTAADPLANLQWNMRMIGATADGAHRRATGRGVDVGIIDTGVDGTHPDLARNFDAARSRNFTMDIPSVDGPCEVPTCIDPNNVDDNGHGTHVAGIVAADNDGFGLAGVAPDARLVNLRAGNDSGFFFVYETVAALTEAGNLGLDVVNMSFFTDPWLWNCASRADYISGDVSDAEIAEQAFIRETVQAAVTYARDRGVTPVAAAGNSHFNLALPERPDSISPDFPPGSERPRVVTNNCLDLPSEGPGVIQVSSVGPSTTKSDFSNYGSPNIEVAAPGGWFRDFVGTPAFQTPENLVLSSYPLDVAIENGLANPDGTPVDNFSVRHCDSSGRCGFYTRLQGTSMASPHAAGVAALIIQAHGNRVRGGGRQLAPVLVGQILGATATDHACPAGGVEIYTDEGRPAEFNAVCEGTILYNGLYGEGIVSATNAVSRR